MAKILRDGMWLIALALALTVGPVAAADKTLLLYGDSLMAGLGLPPEDGFAARLQSALDAAGQDVTVSNASVSGDTSADGLARLDWSLAERPDVVILELGANDMLQGLPVATMRANLAAMLERFRTEQIPVLFVGMKANRGLGDDYVAAYDATFAKLASEYSVPLYPFFLDGVALDASLNQADGIHPNAQGVSRIVEAIVPAVIALLETAR